MDLRSCTHLHFIQAIRAGSVEKIRNLDSRKRPALVFKMLEEIYESEDSKKPDSLSTLQSQDMYADTGLDRDSKTDNPCMPLAERKTKKKKKNTDTDTMHHNSDDDEEGTDGKTTLKQLKEQCKTKKRKVLHSMSLSPKQEYTDWQPEEDECDLKETISSWKSKLPKKLKGKKKRIKKGAASSPQAVVSMESEQIPSAEDSLQSSGCLLAPVNVKVEVLETEYSECRNMFCVADDISDCCSELLGLSGEVSGNILQAELKSGEQISLAEEESQSCVVNKVCYDHLEHIEPNCLLPSIGGETMEADHLKKTCQRSLVFHPSEDKEEGYISDPLPEESSPETNFPVKDQGSDMGNYFQSNSSVDEILRQTSGLCGVQVPDMAMDKSLCSMEFGSAGDPCKFEDGIDEGGLPSLEMDSLSTPLSNCSASLKSNHCPSPETVLVSADDDPLVTEKPPVVSISADTARNCLSPDKNPFVFEGSSTTKEESQPLESAPDDAESNFSKRNRHCDVLHQSSLRVIKNYYHSEESYPPERLLSTRKAISPTSQEKLCQAMKDVELDEKTYHYECNDELQFRKETENKASPLGPDTEGAEVNTNSKRLGELTKKPKNDRKSSPPKGCRRGPHFSHSIPHVSTGATSIQSCSERAIAFSQRQMHDIEGLATKLMQEMKFMKDIVEGQLHSEVPPTTFLKYDVDEVKTAIKNATKVEETTRKWLSMMARDCNRFCKLMKLNEKGENASGNAIQKGRKKITFADEAGGVLCHVKFIEDSMASLDSKS